MNKETKIAELISKNILNLSKKEKEGKCNLSKELKNKIDKSFDNLNMKNEI